jgi:hypothetical protein
MYNIVKAEGIWQMSIKERHRSANHNNRIVTREKERRGVQKRRSPSKEWAEEEWDICTICWSEVVSTTVQPTFNLLRISTMGQFFSHPEMGLAQLPAAN